MLTRCIGRGSRGLGTAFGGTTLTLLSIASGWVLPHSLVSLTLHDPDRSPDHPGASGEDVGGFHPFQLCLCLSSLKWDVLEWGGKHHIWGPERTQWGVVTVVGGQVGLIRDMKVGARVCLVPKYVIFLNSLPSPRP